jgi:adenosylcobinamide-GDP ribazoletransferase
MSNALKSALASLSAFTRLPIPSPPWDEGCQKLAIGFLPLSGIAIGLFHALWIALCRSLGIGASLYAAGAVAIPALATGGVHLDGFCDTVDALSSWAGRERMLDIMKDPHCGAFAVIWCQTLLLSSFGIQSELASRHLEILACFSYPLARCGSAFFALFLPQARPGGMLASFSGHADKKECCLFLSVFALGSSLALGLTKPFSLLGGLGFGLFSSWSFRRMALKRFGGITGDLAGFHTVVSELFICLGFLGGALL